MASGAGDGGRFRLRLEDIDQTRCRDEYAAAILEDLVWLGLSWDGPVRRQSEHFDDYQRALDQLEGMVVLYPCFCTRREVRDEIARAGGAPHTQSGPPYPGTCRDLDLQHRTEKQRSGIDYALLLDLARALALTGPVEWVEEEEDGPHRKLADPAPLGDVVLARTCRRAIILLLPSTTRSKELLRDPRRRFGDGDACPSRFASATGPTDAALPSS